MDLYAPPNPLGKGGFGDNPQNRATGRWKPEESIPYLQNKLMRMTVDELEKWHADNSKTMSMAALIAYNAVKAATIDLQYMKEVTDRTSGKAMQTIDHTTGGERLTPISVIVHDTKVQAQLSSFGQELMGIDGNQDNAGIRQAIEQSQEQNPDFTGRDK